MSVSWSRRERGDPAAACNRHASNLHFLFTNASTRINLAQSPLACKDPSQFTVTLTLCSVREDESRRNAEFQATAAGLKPTLRGAD